MWHAEKVQLALRRVLPLNRLRVQRRMRTNVNTNWLHRLGTFLLSIKIARGTCLK